MEKIHLPLTAVLQAHRRLQRTLQPTRLIYSPSLSEKSGANVWLKLENTQPTGSFKVRGALNKLSQLTAEEKARGLVLVSAGNHALGVAFAAQTLGGIQAMAFVPATAPRAKIEKLRRFPIAVNQIGQTYAEAHEAAEAHQRATGATFISPYDDVTVIAGQATAGLEILTELPRTDIILVPVGGGGLLAGIASVAHAFSPDCRVMGVQPDTTPAAYLSLRDGVAYDPYDHQPTLADGLAGGFGVVPFAVAHDLIDQILLPTEADLRQAILTLVTQEQLIIEPSGAVAIAPLLNGSLQAQGKTVVCVLSGGNLDTSILRDLLNNADEP